MNRLRHFQFSRRQWRIAGVVFIAVLAYVLLYLNTTTFRYTGGMGGLTGPPTARVFSSERQLMLFYPCYLVERKVRKITSGMRHPFGVELQLRHRRHHPATPGDGT